MKSVLFGAILVGLIATGLCIECYVGIGNVGGRTMTTASGFKACSKSTVVTGDTEIATRAGIIIEAGDNCTDTTILSIKTITCTCPTNYCNSAPASVQALMPVLVVAMMVKFII